MSNSSKPPVWFWVASVLALLWNLMGVGAYLAQAFMTPEALQALPEDQQQLIASTPVWATAAFAIAVWGGLLGSLMLLLRKKLAYTVLIISFVGVLIQMFHSFFISNSIEVYGPGGLVMPIMILLFGIFLIVLAKRATVNGWLK